MSHLLTVHEAAALLRLSDAAVYSLCKSGLLPHRRPSEGKAIRIDRADVRTFIARLQATAPGDSGLCQVPPADPGDAKGNPVGEGTAALIAAMTSHIDSFSERIDSVVERLGRIEAMLADLSQMRTVKEWYSTAEVAKLLDRGEYTIREHCRQGRVRAKKKPCGRGKGGEWLVSHEELTRLRNEGLLPVSPHS